MTKPLYFYNGSTFELVGPTTPQSPIAYQTSAPTAPATGDLWIDSDGDVDTYNRQLTRYYFVATAAQTTITGTDANGLTLAYVAGSEAVYVNGALQVRGQDYTATNGTSVVMSSGLAVNDVVEIFAYTAFTVANAYTKTETDSIAAAAAGLRMVVPTSVAVGSGTATIGTAGQVTFTTASTVSLNGVFNATYDNYLILLKGNTSANPDLLFRLRVAGVDASGSSDYVRPVLYNAQNSSTVANIGGAATSSGYLGFGSTSQFVVNTTFFNPFLTKQTINTLQNYGQDYQLWGGNRHILSNSYDGITFIPVSGTMTGEVAVYGYKD